MYQNDRAEQDLKDSVQEFLASVIATTEGLRELPPKIAQLERNLSGMNPDSDAVLTARFKIASHASVLRDALDSFEGIIRNAERAAGKNALHEIDKTKAQARERRQTAAKNAERDTREAEKGRAVLRSMFQRKEVQK